MIYTYSSCIVWHFILILPVFFLFIYVSYFFINGNKGFLAYYKLKKNHTDKKEQLLSLNIKNSNLQNKIFRLTPNTLDLDYLDEQIRFNIGKISPNEVKIVIENIDKELQ